MPWDAKREMLRLQTDDYKSMISLANTIDQSTLSPWPAFKSVAKPYKMILACTKGEGNDLRMCQ